MYTLKELEKPFIVNFEVTSLCNLDCDFCSAQLSKYKRQDISTKKILEIIRKITTEEIYSIFITGGEPLMREDIIEIVGECIKQSMNVSLSTNGIFATNRIANALFSVGLDEIQVSIQAPDKVNDEIVRESGAFKKSINGLKNLVDAGLRVTVAAVATRRNHLLLPELAKRVSELGVKYFRVQRLMPNSLEDLNEIVPYEEMKKTVKKMFDLDKRLKNFSISIHTPPGFIDSRFFNSREFDILHPLCHTCTAGKASLGILSDGSCVPCLELKDKNFICGNITDLSFNKIWNSRPMRLLREAIPENYKGKCGECEFKWSCYSARCVAYKINGDILGDDESCYLLTKKNPDIKK